MRLNALFRLAFATAPPHGLTSPHATNSQAHSSKGTPSPTRHKCAQAPTDCRRTVSGTISLPSRGTFHHSLTVLVRYRSPGSIQPYQVVLADSRQITGVRRYSGTPTGDHRLSPTGLSPSTVRLPRRSTSPRFYNSSAACQHRPAGSHNPDHATPDRYHTHRFRLHPLSLATTHGITIVFSSCGY